jgi:hypothetical protein
VFVLLVEGGVLALLVESGALALPVENGVDSDCPWFRVKFFVLCMACVLTQGVPVIRNMPAITAAWRVFIRTQFETVQTLGRRT